MRKLIPTQLETPYSLCYWSVGFVLFVTLQAANQETKLLEKRTVTLFGKLAGGEDMTSIAENQFTF